VPTEPVAVAVSLADKIDTLTGFWAIDEKPTGSKDPYALRRAALGVIRIGLSNSSRIPLLETFTDLILQKRGGEAVNSYVDQKADAMSSAVELLETLETEEIQNLASEFAISTLTQELRECVAAGGDLSKFLKEFIQKSNKDAEDLLAFFADRLKVHLRSEGVRHDVIDACFNLGGQDDLVLLVNRVNALQKFVETEDGTNLLAGYKRATNILAAEQKKDGVEYTLDPDAKFAEADEEKALFAALDTADAAIRPALEAEDFAAAMTAMAALRVPIDAFFEKVTVNSGNQVVRRNRLCLLNRVKVVMERVAVFSAIEG
jgi:glycyl-tRNA synthetase beta chain